MMQKVSLFIFTCLLSGCSLLSQDEPLPLYTLKAGTIEPNYSLLEFLEVGMPEGEASLDTSRIAVTPSPYERDYLADGQWPDRLPKVMQEVLIESLSERWGGAHIGRTGTGYQAKYLLQTDIQDFSVYYLNTMRPEIHLKVAFKVVNMSTRRVMVGQFFSVKEPICVLSMKGIVEAFNKGFHALVQQAIPWMEEGFLKESTFNTRNNKLSR